MGGWGEGLLECGAESCACVTHLYGVVHKGYEAENSSRPPHGSREGQTLAQRRSRIVHLERSYAFRGLRVIPFPFFSFDLVPPATPFLHATLARWETPIPVGGNAELLLLNQGRTHIIA